MSSTADLLSSLDLAASIDPDVLRSVFFEDDVEINVGRLNGETVQSFGQFGYDSASNEVRLTATKDGVAIDPALVLRTTGASSVFIKTNDITRWEFTTGDQALGPDGTEAMPSYTFSSSTITGILRSAAGHLTSVSSTGVFIQTHATAGVECQIQAEHTDNTNSGSNAKLKAESGGLNGGDAFLLTTIKDVTDWSVGIDNDDLDTFKIVNAANPSLSPAQFSIALAGNMTARPPGNVFEQKNSTNAQKWRVYNTDDGAGNTEFGGIEWSSNRMFFGTDVTGTGTIRDIGIIIGGSEKWRFDTSGNYITPTDNLLNIGADGTTRPAILFLGTAIVVGTSPASTGAIRIANSLLMESRNFLDTENVRILRVNSSDHLEVGDSTTGVVIQANSSGLIGFYNTAPVAQSAAYTRNAAIVEDRTLLASASATTLNNNNVLAAIIADLQAVGLFG